MTYPCPHRRQHALLVLGLACLLFGLLLTVALMAGAEEKLSDPLCYAEVYPKEFRFVDCGSHGARLVKARSPGPCYVLHAGEVPCDTPGNLSKLQYDLLTRPSPEPQVTWLGHPVFYYHAYPNDPEFVKQEGRFDVEIGLREDGMVVWRKKEAK